MKQLLLLAAIFFLASGARAQSTSSSWRDVTETQFAGGAPNNCSADASAAINSAISGAPAGSGVIFFPAGCYLITTQIVDTNASAFLTYLGEGTVEFRASGTPSGSVIQFGNDTTTVTDRQIENLYFNCNNINNIDGIHLDGLTHSAFDDVVIANCAGTGKAAMSTIGTNLNNYSNVYKGGTIFGTNSNGVQLGAIQPPSATGRSMERLSWSAVPATPALGLITREPVADSLVAP